MTPVPTVRLARTDEHGTILALWERSVRATHHFLSEADIVALRPLVAEELGAPAIQWWVLVSQDDTPRGFMGYTPDRIEGLFIDPAHRGEGSGTRLLEQAARLAAGPLAVEVNEQNPEAIGFYRARGFEIVGHTDTDLGGRPFPLLHLRRPLPGGA